MEQTDSRVVITGLGIVSSLGYSIEAFWENLLLGKLMVKETKRFDPKPYRSKITTDIDHEKIIEELSSEKNKTEYLNTGAKLGLVACRQAIKNANLTDNNRYEEAGISLGSTSGGDIEEYLEHVYQGKKMGKGIIKKSPFFMSMTNIAESLKLRGPACNISSACTSSAVSIGFAYQLVKCSQAKIMLAGGCDVLQESIFAGFNSLRVVAGEKCLPFSIHRKGILIGDGAAILTIEEMEHALNRDAPILAEIMGFGMSCDAFHVTQPHYQGSVMAMSSSIEEAAIQKDDIQYINCHGTGTLLGDKTEATALDLTFGENLSNIYATSTKSSLGHLLGTSGAVEALITILAIKNAVVPPMMDLGPIDKAVKFKVVREKPLPIPIKNAMSNSFGFGGNNVSLIFSKFNQ